MMSLLWDGSNPPLAILLNSLRPNAERLKIKGYFVGKVSFIKLYDNRQKCLRVRLGGFYPDYH